MSIEEVKYWLTQYINNLEYEYIIEGWDVNNFLNIIPIVTAKTEHVVFIYNTETKDLYSHYNDSDKTVLNESKDFKEFIRTETLKLLDSEELISCGENLIDRFFNNKKSLTSNELRILNYCYNHVMSLTRDDFCGYPTNCFFMIKTKEWSYYSITEHLNREYILSIYYDMIEHCLNKYHLCIDEEDSCY